MRFMSAAAISATALKGYQQATQSVNSLMFMLLEVICGRQVFLIRNIRYGHDAECQYLAQMDF
jgi:hypothetical protein